MKLALAAAVAAFALGCGSKSRPADAPDPTVDDATALDYDATCDAWITSLAAWSDCVAGDPEELARVNALLMGASESVFLGDPDAEPEEPDPDRDPDDAPVEPATAQGCRDGAADVRARMAELGCEG